jgi:predicted PurR-regulated permease PerM
MTEGPAWRLITRGTWYVLGAVATVLLVIQVRSVVVQAIVAMIVAASVSPLADRLIQTQMVRGWRWKPGRVVIVLLVYVALGVLAVIFGILLAGTLAEQLALFRANLPQYAAELEQWMSARLPATMDPAVASAAQAMVGRVLGLVSDFISGVASAVGAILGESLSLVFTLIIAVYLASDGERIQRYLLEFVPEAQQSRAEQVMVVSGQRLGAWVRGQIAVSSIVGALFAAGLAILGVPYAMLLGVVAFVGEFVPLVGPFISSIPAILVAFLAGGPSLGIVTIIFCIAVEQLEGDVIVPRILGSATSIHPVAVMLAILAGAQLAGATGALLAVPVAGFASVLIDEVKRGHAQVKYADAANWGTPAPIKDES